MTHRILVVEDNPDNLKMMRWFMKDHHFEIEEAETGPIALQRLREKSFDLVLMDISLPGMSGEEVVRELRKEEAYAKLPIVAITAHALTDECEKIMEAGFSNLMIKPINEDALLEIIEEELKESKV